MYPWLLIAMFHMAPFQQCFYFFPLWNPLYNTLWQSLIPDPLELFTPNRLYISISEEQPFSIHIFFIIINLKFFPGFEIFSHYRSTRIPTASNLLLFCFLTSQVSATCIKPMYRKYYVLSYCEFSCSTNFHNKFNSLPVLKYLCRD